MRVNINGQFFEFDYGAPHQQEVDPVIEQCEKDAIDYFGATKIGMRAALPPEEKKRIFEFLKARKKYYDENGLLIE